MSDSSKQPISLDQIYLDPNNYRFRDFKEYKEIHDEMITDPIVQKRTENFIIGKKNEGINDLIASFKKSGFLPVDQIQVVKIKDGIYKVIEGNRRIATLKYLQRLYEKEGHSIGNLNPNTFENIPVVHYEKDDGDADLHYKVLMGLKHINGNKRWPLVNQAQLMKDMSDGGMSEDDIIDSLGISKTRLRRSLRALSLVKAYKNSDFGDQFQSDMFNIFDAAVSSTNIKWWLGWDDDTMVSNNKKNLERLFSWVSKVEEQVYEEENKQNENNVQVREPFIRTGRDVRELAKFISDEKALQFMEEVGSIAEAYLSSDQVGKDRFETVLNSLETNLNTALALSSYSSPHHSEKIDNINKKIKGLIASQDLTDILLPKSIKPQILFDFPNTTHFSSIDIKSYKNFSGLIIKRLKRINLFAGENNSGKTSLLEAIRLLIAQNDANDFLALQLQRGKFIKGKLNPAWVVDNIKNDIHVEGEFGILNSISEIKINPEKEKNEEIDISAYLGSFRFESSFMGKNHNTNLRLFEKAGNNYELSSKSGLNHLCKFAAYTPFGGYNNVQLYNAHAESVIKKHLPACINFLKEHIDEDLNDIQLVRDYGLLRFQVNHEKFKNTMDLTQFGDGLQNIFKTIILFAIAENGIVLIDEIETAIHYSLLTKYTRFIQELAEKFNTQVFITSHSGECIDAFVENEYLNDKISMYHLENEDGTVSCKYISGNRYKELNDLMGIDLRD